METSSRTEWTAGTGSGSNSRCPLRIFAITLTSSVPPTNPESNGGEETNLTCCISPCASRIAGRGTPQVFGMLKGGNDVQNSARRFVDELRGDKHETARFGPACRLYRLR